MVDTSEPRPRPVSSGDRDPYRPGYEIAAEQILEYVAQQQLRPGDRLPTEKEFSAILGVSRTVAREAIRSLAALGRLSVRKRAGIFVAPGTTALEEESLYLFLPANPEQVYELFELRRTLEQEASRLAADRATPQEVKAIRAAVERGFEAAARDDFALFREADEEFHHSIAAAAHNRFFESTIASVTQLRRQVIEIGLSGSSSGSLQAAAQQHRAVLDAIADGDSERAAAAMAEHIDITREQFQHEIQRRLSSAPDTP